MARDKIKRYIDCYVPVTTCNFRCEYCYITLSGAFANEIPTFDYTPEYIAQALSKKRLGGPCVITLCGGGETLLPKEIPSIVEGLLAEGHYVMIVTNGILTTQFNKLAEMPLECRERLFIKFSFHYLELKNRKLFDVFFNNINTMQEASISYTLELTQHDELIPLIPEIQELCMERVGALCHVTVARDSRDPLLPILTQHSKEEYQKIWSVFDSPLFEYKLSTFNVKRKEFCYAGDWTFTMNLGNGDMWQCYEGKKLFNLYEDVNQPINFCATGNNCRESHCYNAHSFLTFGAIPEIKPPHYDKMRNRITKDGESWVGDNVKNIFQTRCAESNIEYSMLEKLIVNYRNKNDLVDQQIPVTLKDVIKSKIKKMIGK